MAAATTWWAYRYNFAVRLRGLGRGLGDAAGNNTVPYQGQRYGLIRDGNARQDCERKFAPDCDVVAYWAWGLITVIEPKSVCILVRLAYASVCSKMCREYWMALVIVRRVALSHCSAMQRKVPLLLDIKVVASHLTRGRSSRVLGVQQEDLHGGVTGASFRSMTESRLGRGALLIGTWVACDPSDPRPASSLQA